MARASPSMVAMLSTKMLISTCWATSTDEGQAGRDGQTGDQQGHARRDQRGEHEDEDQRGDGQRHDLGSLEVLLGQLGRVGGQRAVAGHARLVAGRWRDRRPQLVDDLDRGLVAHVQPDQDVRRVTGGADEPVVAGLGVADDLGHPRVVGEIRDGRSQGGLEGAGPGIRAGRRGLDDHDDRALARPELLVEAIADDGRFRIGVQPAAAAEGARGLAGERARERRGDDREDDHGSSEAVDEAAPASEHRSTFERSGRPEP